ncbi:HAMP domain-containing sensor histidine kinase [Clostridium gasigenes]|uniref:sensor histidine kinase n=1 Tax=Clostridium gasigenes TaxID=94869 RepID=UPI00311AA51E
MLVIKLKEIIKRYLRGIWGIEILVLVILIGFLTISYVKEFNRQNRPGVFDSLFNEQKFIKDTIYSETEEIANMIYYLSNNLKYIEDYDVDKKIEAKVYGESLKNTYKYAILNKTTGNIITSDYGLEEFYGPNYGLIDSEDVLRYLKNRGFANIMIDNVDTFNSYINSDIKYVEKEGLSNYEEFYYTYPEGYKELIREKAITAKLMIVTTIISILLFFKLLINIVTNGKEVNLKINTVHRLFYVLRYGFKYKYTRNKLVTAIVAAFIVIVSYLYLVASIRNQNLLLTLLTKYPFKGTLFIVLIPLLCIVYTVKKTLDIAMINEGLKKLNDGNLDYDIDDIGQKEVKELVDNINQIKDGYKIAVNEKVKNEKLKTELISNVSHDLKTPLTSIINYVNILKDPNITEDERLDYLDILEKKSLKLKGLIEDLFEVSKLNSGKMILNKSDVDIIALVHQGVGEYSSLYEEKNIEFKVSSKEDELVINLDGKLMSRVFENIIINALKYSLDNTRVYINITNKDNELEIDFKNISNYEMNFNEEEIFERFERADQSRNSAVEGSGIGLAIARSIVELHNGNIKIDVEGDMFKLYIKIPK